MNETLRRCLEDLEERIDPEQEQALWDQWKCYARGEWQEDIFSPRRTKGAPARVDWPKISVNAALDDFDQMALQQLRECSDHLEKGSGGILNVRCNYGTGIMPLLFGVEPFVMPGELDTLPTTLPFHDSGRIDAIIEAGVPDLESGIGRKVFDMARHFQEAFRPYPKVQRWVPIYHPDLQGPLDICELLWGSEIFMALYTDGDRVHRLLNLVTDTYIAYMREWAKVVPFAEDFNSHLGLLIRGKIMLRDDSAMNVSPDLFDEFARPYDQRLLDEFGGGAVHFCGRGDHYIPFLTKMENLTAINMSQPEYNDMEKIYSCTVDRGINIVGFDRNAANEAKAQGRSFNGRLHCHV
ncbi:hypothetical protein HQ520_07640 [bacterium]|nr:hypothetical protein [bacterium]